MVQILRSEECMGKRLDIYPFTSNFTEGVWPRNGRCGLGTRLQAPLPSVYSHSTKTPADVFTLL